MKKVKHVTFKAHENTEQLVQFKPLYLLSTESLEPSKQVRIFISSCEKNCYIQEKGNWQEFIHNGFLFSPESKTYCFPVKNIYRYLDIPYQDQPYLTLAKNPKHKVLLKSIELSEEILREFALPNLEQLDSSGIAKTKLEAEKILQLKAYMSECRINIKDLETKVITLLELRSALEKLDRDREDPVTLADVDEQIKLFKRKIHTYEARIQKNQNKIQTILTKEKIFKSEWYERTMPEFKLQKKEISQEIQKIEFAVGKLHETFECFKDLTISWVEPVPLSVEDIQQQIQLLEKEKLRYESQQQHIEKKIIALDEQEATIQETALTHDEAKQLFFSGKAKESNSISEPELKNLSLNCHGERM
ncbi:MAG: hypothetical protein WA659_01895 [Candidatus Aquirickettsiella sp.]